jgi:hypothetical protein
MRKRTLFVIVALVFAVPALASDPFRKPDVAVTRAGSVWIPDESAPSVCFELRLLKMPTAFYRELNVKLPDDGLLSAADAKKLLDAAQLCRRASVVACPKITAASGQAATFRSCDEQSFVTSIEATKVKGQTVLVPQNKRVELGTGATLTGSVSPDGKGVRVRAKLARKWLAGPVELVPVVTKVTPIFEGGSVGVPIPFTQYLQAPEVRTASVEKSATVPNGGTLAVGVWSETEEAKDARKQAKPEAVEYTWVALAAVRVLRAESAAKPVPTMQLPEPLGK